MKHDIDPDRAPQAGGAVRAGALLALVSSAAALAGLVHWLAGDALGAIVCEGAVHAWYLPVGLCLFVLRAGARRETRRAFSLALFLLGIGALTARAYDARGAEAENGRPVPHQS